MQLLQCTASLPGGSRPCNPCNALPHCPGAVGRATPAMHCLTALGAVGSATPAMHCLTAWGQWAVQLLQRTASLPGGSGQCNSCNALPYCLGAVGCVQWSECPAGPVGILNRAYRPAGTGSLAHGVVGLSCRACGEVEPGPPAWGDGESCPVGGRSLLQGPWGGVFFGEPGPPAWGGRGVQPTGWSEPPSRPMGRRHLRRTGPTGLGGTGSPAQGVVGASFKAHGEASPSENRAHRPGGGGESSPGGGRSLLQGPWGGVTFGEPAWGGRGVQPRGWSEPPSRPMGRRLLRRTGPTGLGGTGSPAQGVVGASFKAHGEASSSENRAHRPGGDGESSPGGGRSLL